MSDEKFPKYIQTELEKSKTYCENMAATVAFNNVTGTEYISPYFYKYAEQTSSPLHDVDDDSIPDELVNLLVEGELADHYPKNHKYEEVQIQFEGILSNLREGIIAQAKEAHRRKILTYGGWALAILVLTGWFGGYNLYKRYQDDVNWQKINTPTVYSGEGFEIKFPVSDAKVIIVNNDEDLSSKMVSGIYYGGNDHQSLDVYDVTVTKFLSNKYNPQADIQCVDIPKGADPLQPYQHVIYNEKRIIDGVTINICDWDNDPRVYAKMLRNNNVVYTIAVSATDQKTTYSKFNDFLATFRFQ